MIDYHDKNPSIPSVHIMQSKAFELHKGRSSYCINRAVVKMAISMKFDA